jgi:hypothetical protein
MEDISRKVTKGIVFAGCSFTWGQGLYYYSNLPTIKRPMPGRYDADLVSYSHYEYMCSVRFPRLVANHFNTFELCQPWNGGSTDDITKFWNNAFDITNLQEVGSPRYNYDFKYIREKSLNGDYNAKKYDYADVSHIVYQFTQWTRSESLLIKNSEDKQFYSHLNTMQDPMFTELLQEVNMTQEQYVESAMLAEIQKVKSMLQNFENHGVKSYVISWPFDIIPYIKSDVWLSERLIEFEYNNNHYTNIEDMIGTVAHSRAKHKELMIATDFDMFDNPPQDHHPSLKCHQVIAKNIIKVMEKENVAI